MACLDCSRLSYAYALWGVLAGGFVLVCLVGAYLERKR